MVPPGSNRISHIKTKFTNNGTECIPRAYLMQSSHAHRRVQVELMYGQCPSSAE